MHRIFSKSLFSISVLLLAVWGVFSPLLSAKTQDLQTSSTSTASSQQQAKEIDDKITVLKKWQEGYQLTAERANFKANRLQFRQDEYVDSRRLYKIAQQANQKVKDIQLLIDDLEAEKSKLLKSNGQNVEEKK